MKPDWPLKLSEVTDAEARKVPAALATLSPLPLSEAASYTVTA